MIYSQAVAISSSAWNLGGTLSRPPAPPQLLQGKALMGNVSSGRFQALCKVVSVLKIISDKTARCGWMYNYTVSAIFCSSQKSWSVLN